MASSSSHPALSVLDLVPVSAGQTRAEALKDMLALARTADEAGYRRYWIAEHHGSTTFLASATTVLMGQVLASTSSIAVASGGVMLPNHAPLIVAEQIGTLATLYPGRVTLGLGRAPGTDAVTAAALRRRTADPRHFAEEVIETLSYLGSVPQAATEGVPTSLDLAGAAQGTGPSMALADAQVRELAASLDAGSLGGASPQASSQAADVPTPQLRGQQVPAPGPHVRAIPGEGTQVEPWILGSSVNGARVAGVLGLPFAVASHFVPAQAEAAIVTYRSVFDAEAPTSRAAHPRAAATVNVMVAPTKSEAEEHFTTAMAASARILGGMPAPLDPPTHDRQAWRAYAGGRDAAVEQAMALSYVGTADEVAHGLASLASRWDLEEILVVTYAYDSAVRRRSYELLAEAFARL